MKTEKPEGYSRLDYKKRSSATYFMKILRDVKTKHESVPLLFSGMFSPMKPIMGKGPRVLSKHDSQSKSQIASPSEIII